MVGNTNLEKEIYHLNRREKEKEREGGRERLSVSALCHGVINIQFSSGAASLHTLTLSLSLSLLQVAVLNVSCINQPSGFRVHTIQVCYSWHANRRAASGVPVSAQDARPEQICSVCLCMHVCLCAHVHKASVHYVQKAVFYTLTACVCAWVCECVPRRQRAYECLACVLNITAANPSKEITSLTLSPRGVMCRETQFC